MGVGYNGRGFSFKWNNSHSDGALVSRVNTSTPYTGSFDVSIRFFL